MILKLTGLFLISAAGGLLGVNASNKLRDRKLFLEKFIALMQETKARISFSLCDLSELFGSSTGCEPLDFITRRFTEGIKAQGSADCSWKKAVDAAFKRYRLFEADKELISDFGSKLGRNDMDGELSHIDLYTALAQDRLKEARTELIQKGRLYRTLGLFGGICVSLIIL